MPGDSFYWSPTENDSDESLLEKEPYIDPWDLENYAYIREHLDSMELSSTPSVPGGSSAGEFAEPTSSFDYVPARNRRRTEITAPPVMSHVREERFDSMLSDYENYAAIDDIHNTHRRNRRAASEMYWPSRRRAMYEYESEAEDVSPYAEAISQENSVFGIYDEKGMFRRVALPVTLRTRDRSLSYSYGDFDHYHEFNPRVDHQSTFDELRDRTDRRDATLPIYDDLCRQKRAKKPQNFGFSKYGHLKIDYSCSWNNLNKYMKYN